MAKPAQSNHIPAVCFAPELTDEKLAEYEKLISACGDEEVKDAGLECLAAVKAWWDLPESQRTDKVKYEILGGTADKRTIHKYEVQPLEDEHVKKLWSAVPWMSECARIAAVFERVSEGPLRNALFHLQWFCAELTLDREPLTQSKLVPSS